MPNDVYVEPEINLKYCLRRLKPGRKTARREIHYRIVRGLHKEYRTECWQSSIRFATH